MYTNIIRRYFEGENIPIVSDRYVISCYLLYCTLWCWRYISLECLLPARPCTVSRRLKLPRPVRALRGQRRAEILLRGQRRRVPVNGCRAHPSVIAVAAFYRRCSFQGGGDETHQTVFISDRHRRHRPRTCMHHNVRTYTGGSPKTSRIHRTFAWYAPGVLIII